MKVKNDVFMEMLYDTYKPGFKMCEASNALHALAKEYGFCDDPRYKEASLKSLDAMNEFQDMGVDRCVRLFKSNTLIDKINESWIGRYLVNKAKKELGR